MLGVTDQDIAMNFLSSCILFLSVLGTVFGQFNLAAEVVAAGADAVAAETDVVAAETDVVVEEPEYDKEGKCKLTVKTLEDIRETKAKIADVMAKLKIYATSIGLEIPTEEPAVPPTEGPTDTPPAIRLTNCKDLLDANYRTDGVYSVLIGESETPVNVYCDMTTDFGGWTVIQRRQDGSVDFNRTFNEYAVGFGDLTGEFWMGNELISAMTKATPMELRIDMTDFGDVTAYSKYASFSLGGASKNYRLKVDGYRDEGMGGNSLSYHNKFSFSTYDTDNDDSSVRNCALIHNGGWWFKNCLRANLNGMYFPEGVNSTYAEGIVWSRFKGLKYSLKFTEMKIRPVTV